MLRFVKTLLCGKQRIEDLKENSDIKNSFRLSQLSKHRKDFSRFMHCQLQKNNLVEQIFKDCFEVNRQIYSILYKSPVSFSCLSDKAEPFERNIRQITQFELSKIDKELFEKKIAILENESILDWMSLEKNEQDQVAFICQNWQKAINQFILKPTNMRSIIRLGETIVTKPCDFSKQINDLKRIRLEIFFYCSIGFLYKPNTRLLMRISTQFIKTLTTFIEIQKVEHDSSLTTYFSSLSKALGYLKKALFLTLFYVHYELSNKFTEYNSISYPPIYLLEPNENSKDGFPILLIETLSSYCDFCSHRLNYVETQLFKFKHDKYKSILKSVSRLIQLCSLVRDSLIFKKKIDYEIEILYYFVYQEVNSINLNFKELNK